MFARPGFGGQLRVPECDCNLCADSLLASNIVKAAGNDGGLAWLKKASASSTSNCSQGAPFLFIN